MFQVGDKIVHPMHGAGIIDSIVQKKVNGVVRDYYILKLPVGGMLVMIPTANSEEIGVRPVVKGDEADRVIAAIPDIEVDMTPNWNRRYRENMLRLKSGNLLEVARVVKGLMLREEERGLSRLPDRPAPGDPDEPAAQAACPPAHHRGQPRPPPCGGLHPRR